MTVNKIDNPNEDWVKELKCRSTSLMDNYNTRVDSYFMYSLLAVTFIYGGGLAATFNGTNSIALLIITISSIGIISLFMYAACYAYQWMDRERLLVQTIERFYDGNIITNQFNRFIVFDDFKKVGWDDEEANKAKEKGFDFLVKSPNGIINADWLKALAFQVAHPHPIINRTAAFARMASIQRRPFLAINFIILWTSLNISQVVFHQDFIISMASNTFFLSIIFMLLSGIIFFVIYCLIEYFMKKLKKGRFIFEN